MQQQPDGGWGWVIAVGNLYITAIFAASMRCYSVFYSPLMAEFDADYGQVSWINGSMQLSYGIACAIGSGLLQKFGIRPTVIVCGFIASAACFSASFFHQLWHVQLCMGIICGAAYGPIMLGAFTIVSRYFDKKLYTAMQVMCIGLSIGPFIACPLYQWLIDTYGWRGALQIMSGLYLNFVLSGALMRPITLDPAPPKEVNNNTSITAKQLQHLENLASNHTEENKQNSGEPDMASTQEISIKTRFNNIDDGDFLTSQTLSVVEIGGRQRRLEKRMFEKSKGRRKSSVYENAAMIAKKIDLVVFTDPVFYIYSLSWVGFATAYFSTLVYLVPYGQQEMGFDLMTSSSLISAFAMGEMAARIFMGIAIDRLPDNKKLVVVSVFFVIIAVVLMVMPHMPTFSSLVALCALLGLFGGSMDGIFSAVIVEMFGMDLYSSAFGYSNIFIHAMGTGATVLMGVAVDQSGSFLITFYVGAASVLVASISTFCLNCILTKRRRKREKY